MLAARGSIKLELRHHRHVDCVESMTTTTHVHRSVYFDTKSNTSTYDTYDTKHLSAQKAQLMLPYDGSNLPNIRTM